MVRKSKQERRRNVSPRKHQYTGNKKTGAQSTCAFKAHENAVAGEAAKSFFIPKIK